MVEIPVIPWQGRFWKLFVMTPDVRSVHSLKKIRITDPTVCWYMQQSVQDGIAVTIPWLRVHQARTDRDALSEIMYLDEYSILLRQVRK